MQNVKIFYTYARKVADFINKVILVLAVILAITGFFLHYHSQDLAKVSNKNLNTMRTSLYDILNNEELNSTSYGKTQVMVLRTTYCWMIGEGCTDNPADGDSNYSSSLIGKMAFLISVPYSNPPASGLAWINDTLQNSGFAPKAYADGLGFNSLSAFAGIWTLFKNMTYFVMAIAIVIVGFLIMFRYEIDSQTVISIENSLPRFVLTLLFITFSFAIAGFLVDMMYIMLIVIFGLFGTLQIPGLQATRLQELYLLSNAPLTEDLFNAKYLNFYIQGIQGLVNYVPLWIKGIIYPILSILAYFLLYNTLSKMPQDALGKLTAEGGIIAFNAKADLPGILTSIVIGILLVIFIPIFFQLILPLLLGIFIMLFLFFRILFLLLGTYTRIVIDIIFAPVMILPNVIPGNSSFTDWLKRLVGNLLVFPITIVLLITVQLIAINDEHLGIINVGSPQTQFTLPLLNMETSQLVPIIAAAFMMLIPQLVAKVRDSIAGEPVVDAGPGVLFAGIGGAVGAVVGQYAGLASFSRTVDPNSRVGRAVSFIPGLRQSVSQATPPQDGRISPGSQPPDAGGDNN